MRRIGGWILKNDSYLLIRNRIYPFGLLMKKRWDQCLIQMMKLNFLIKTGIKDQMIFFATIRSVT